MLFWEASGAIIIGDHRYALWRVWNKHLPLMAVTMLNPSTADDKKNDMTILQLIKIAAAMGFGGTYVTNLYAYRATSPADMLAAEDPIGPFNDRFVADAMRQFSYQVAAWGTQAGDDRVDRFLLTAARWGRTIRVLALTKDGHPHHPLRMKTSYEHPVWRDYR